MNKLSYTFVAILFTLIGMSFVAFNSYSQNSGVQFVNKIVASDRQTGDLFGIAVDISADYAINGAQHEAHDVSGSNALSQAGSAYISKRDSNGNWAEVQKIVALQNEYGVTYWTVETDRGRREFVAKSVAENAQWLTETRLMIFDVDGNRFEVPDMKALDRKSQDLLGSVL